MSDEPVLLTHNLVRTNGGAWRCVDCGAMGSTVRNVSLVSPTCPKPSTDNSNLLAALDGTLGKS